jgi:hypothetical protein
MPHSCSALAKEQRHGDDNSAEHQQGCHGFDHKEATIAIAPAMVLPSSGAVRELITGRFPIEEGAKAPHRQVFGHQGRGRRGRPAMSPELAAEWIDVVSSPPSR